MQQTKKNPRLGHADRNRESFFENIDDISYCSRRICGKQIGTLRLRILGGVLSFARTHGTAAFLLAGSGIDGCFPNMSFATPPP